jgi:hypothetical protein
MPATNSLVLPLVLWDNIAPNCNLSSILINENETHIITGTTSGHIIIWEFQVDDVSVTKKNTIFYIINKINAFRFLRYAF